MENMAALVAPQMQIFHSCANFWFFHAFYKSCLAFVVQFWAFLLILHDIGHFLHLLEKPHIFVLTVYNGRIYLLLV